MWPHAAPTRVAADPDTPEWVDGGARALRYYWVMDENQPQAGRSSSTRRVVIEEPGPQLVEAVRAQLDLPAPDSHGYWEIAGVRSVEVVVQLTRVTHYGSDGTTEQPIMWDTDRPQPPGGDPRRG